jgi:hypothetical protein
MSWTILVAETPLVSAKVSVLGFGQLQFTKTLAESPKPKNRLAGIMKFLAGNYEIS